MITKKDLIEDLKDFPIEVVEKMIERQVGQGNKADVSVFQFRVHSDQSHGGFTWSKTPEGITFWNDVTKGNFDRFFKKYPKRNTKVYIRGNSKRGKEVIAELESRGGINEFNQNGTSENNLYFMRPDTNTIDHCLATSLVGYFLQEAYTEITLPEEPLELTLREIAEKFGVSTVKIVE